MAAIGQPFTQPIPTINEAGPAWGNDANAVFNEVISRLTQTIDSPSIALTTGDVKHATRTRLLGAASAMGPSADWNAASAGNSAFWAGAGATDSVEWVPPIEANQRLTAVRVTGRVAGVATAWSFKVWLNTPSAGTRAQLGTTQTSATTINTISQLTLSGINTTLAAGQYISVEWISGAASNRAIHMEYDYDRQVAT